MLELYADENTNYACLRIKKDVLGHNFLYIKL